jgi:hypothetical protein
VWTRRERERLRYSPPGMSDGTPEAAGRRARLRAWARRPGADVAVVGLAVAVLAGVYLVLFGGPRGAPPPPALTPGMVARLWALPERTVIPARLELAGSDADEPDQRPARKEGAAVGLWFQVEATSRPLVLERQAELRTVQLFPRPGQPSEPVPPGGRVFVTDADGGLYVVRDPPGPRWVHLIVFPPDVDPLTLPAAELARVAPRVTVIERRYVAAFREAPDE